MTLKHRCSIFLIFIMIGGLLALADAACCYTDASALGRIRLLRGEDDFKKIYRFTDRGDFRHCLEPKDESQTRLAPEK